MNKSRPPKNPKTPKPRTTAQLVAAQRAHLRDLGEALRAVDPSESWASRAAAIVLTREVFEATVRLRDLLLEQVEDPRSGTRTIAAAHQLAEALTASLLENADAVDERVYARLPLA